MWWPRWSRGKSFPLVLRGRKNCWRCHRDLYHCLPSLCPSVSISPLFSLSRTGSQVYDVKLFPEDPVELIVGEALALNCTAWVEFNTGVDIKWSYPRKQVWGSESWSWWMAPVNKNLNVISSHQPNREDTKPSRKALSHNTEAVSFLTILSVNVGDTGPYICNVTIVGTTITRQTQVIVYGKH